MVQSQINAGPASGQIASLRVDQVTLPARGPGTIDQETTLNFNSTRIVTISNVRDDQDNDNLFWILFTTLASAFVFCYFNQSDAVHKQCFIENRTASWSPT